MTLVRNPARLPRVLVFSSVPAVCSSFFVGERWENWNWNNPDKSELRLPEESFEMVSAGNSNLWSPFFCYAIATESQPDDHNPFLFSPPLSVSLPFPLLFPNSSSSLPLCLLVSRSSSTRMTSVSLPTSTAILLSSHSSIVCGVVLMNSLR